MHLTVAVCTYRPLAKHITRCLEGLRAQTLPYARWELLFVCDEPTRDSIQRLGLDWHPNVVFLPETGKGIAKARLQALRRFAEDPREGILLFVDDDNVLASDFLETGLHLAETEPELGCWGGQLLPEFEEKPPAWTQEYGKYIAIFPLDTTRRAAAFKGDFDGVPPTAGMFLCKEVARHFLHLVDTHPERMALGGTRAHPLCGEDMDIGLSAFDVGRQVARFPELKLTHLIPPNRMTEDYIARLLTSIRAGTLVLQAIRGISMPKASRLSLWMDWLRAHRLPGRHRKFMLAEIRGEFQARDIIRKHHIKGEPGGQNARHAGVSAPRHVAAL
jgi:glycosyltransferase involved in cell wall biosynthesis